MYIPWWRLSQITHDANSHKHNNSLTSFNEALIKPKRWTSLNGSVVVSHKTESGVRFCIDVRVILNDLGHSRSQDQNKVHTEKSFQNSQTFSQNLA